MTPTAVAVMQLSAAKTRSALPGWLPGQGSPAVASTACAAAGLKVGSGAT